MQTQTIKEGKLQYLDWTLTYAADWKPSDKQGDPVASADTTDVFFIVKRQDKDDTIILQKQVTGTGGIVWNSPTAGTITVTFGSETLGKAGNYRYEVVIELADGSFVTADDLRGDFIIEKSIAGNP